MDLLLLSTCLAAGCLESCSQDETKAVNYEEKKAVVAHAGKQASTIWNAKSAAAYLDQREIWWMKWPRSERDRGTFCVSCHTVVPYIIARPALRKALAEDSPTPEENLLLANVTKRVRLWKEVAPFYNDHENTPPTHAKSRSTHPLLNAFLLAN